ncbi:hypothetical protein [Cyanobacterium aponinum]|uniref:hypothetical protein n=1 Tax=Cyanobacterium aponinum TaxID=379064 RepID=UPI000C129C2F|nr:hypothetical protein [Cyanobacterium aponinum]PHV63748.1 hypothetical protein CSQ80_04035 [Cyanobacterium aponinum IPPAS B-1201]
MMIDSIKDLARWLFPKPLVNYLHEDGIVQIIFPQWSDNEHGYNNPEIKLAFVVNYNAKESYFSRHPLYTLPEQDNEYVMIGCWHYDSDRIRSWQEYVKFAEFTASQLHPDLLEAKKVIDDFQKIMTEKKDKKYLSWEQFHKLLSTWQWIALQDLKVIEIIDGKIFYLL